MGRELVRQLVAEGCNVAMCDVSARGHGRDASGSARPPGLPQGLRVTTHVADVSIEAQSCASATRLVEQQDDRQHPSAVQQCRHRRRRQLRQQRARRVGAHLQHLLGRRLSRRPRLPADAAEGRRGPHRQHVERQRLLGLRRPGRPHTAYCRRQVRGEGLHRGADHRSAAQRAAHQMLGRDARPYRHLDHRQLAQGAERQREPTR